MTTTDADRGRVIGLQERRLGKTILRTYRAKADIDDVLPNERQPRLTHLNIHRSIEGELEPHPYLFVCTRDMLLRPTSARARHLVALRAIDVSGNDAVKLLVRRTLH